MEGLVNVIEEAEVNYFLFCCNFFFSEIRIKLSTEYEGRTETVENLKRVMK